MFGKFSFLSIAVLFLSCSCALALSPDQTYNLYMLPAITEDLGMGTQSMSFNHPYITYTHYLDPSAYQTTSLRIPFHVEPQIPSDTSQQTFTFTVSATTSDITWARVIFDWSATNEVTLQLDPSNLSTTSSTSGTTTTIPVEPTAPYIFELQGRVGYVYGPSNVVQYEDRILRVMIYLKLMKTDIARTIPSFFQLQQSTSATKQYISSNGATAFPSFTLQTNEVYQFNCGTQSSVLDMSQACIWGKTSSTATTTTISSADVIWADESSQITLGSGILRITSPLYTNGFVFVPTGTTLIIDPGEKQSVSIFSLQNQPTLVNNGVIIVRSGILRIIGTSMIGSGNLIVEKTGQVEIDSQKAQITFGLETAKTTSSPSLSTTTLLSPQLQFNGNNQFLPVIYSEGTVTFISGNHIFLRSFIFLSTSLLQVASSATLQLYSPKQNYLQSLFPSYIIGGLFNGNIDQTQFPQINELSFLCGGSIIVKPDTSLIFGSTAKFDGLGRLSMGLNANLTIAISFYSVTSSTTIDASQTTSSAGVYFNGPQTERPNGGAGFQCDGCAITIQKGGLVTSSGFTTSNAQASSIFISSTGYLHFLGKYAANLITGKQLTNFGDILILNGASVDFNTPITSYTHIRALDSSTTIYLTSTQGLYKFYRSKGTRYATTSANNGAGSTSSSLANNPTHLFALYIPGILIIRDSVNVQLITDIVDSELTSTQGALFYIAGVYNSGTLFVDTNANLEVYTYTQSIEPIQLDGATPATFTKNTKTIAGVQGDQIIQSSPNLILTTPSSAFSQVPYNKYIYNSQYGVIYDTTGATTTTTTDASTSTTSNINIVYGHVLSNSSPLVLATNTNTGTIYNGFNAQLTMYPKATFSPGSTIPIEEFITSNGVVLDQKYNIKDMTSVNFIKSYENKEYIPSFSRSLVGSVTAYPSTQFDVDIIYNPSDGKIYTDQIIFGTFAGSTIQDNILINKKTILDNIIINIFTNLSTTAQTITIIPPNNTNNNNNNNNNNGGNNVNDSGASTNGANGANDAVGTNNVPAANAMTTLSVGAANADTANTNLKFKYTPHSQLTHDQRIDQYNEIRQDKAFIDNYLPTDSAPYDTLLLGRSDQRTHFSSQNQGQQLQMRQVTTLTTNTAHDTGTTDDASTTPPNDNTNNNTNTTNDNSNVAYDPAYQKFILPFFQTSEQQTDKTINLLSATVKTINIIPITPSFPASTTSSSSSVTGSSAVSPFTNAFVISDHSYSPTVSNDNLRFEIAVNSKQVQLIAYAESKSSALLVKASVSLLLFITLFSLILM